MKTMTYTGELTVERCGECGIHFAMPSDLSNTARANHDVWFWCPLGHKLHFLGETEEQKLRRQLRSAQARATRAEDQAEAERRSKIALKGHLTRARRKIAVGTCPVSDCGQHFGNVAAHMVAKHPGWHLIDPETGEKAVL
jgi:hypothetical protein